MDYACYVPLNFGTIGTATQGVCRWEQTPICLSYRSISLYIVCHIKKEGYNSTAYKHTILIKSDQDIRQQDGLYIV